MQKRSIFLQNLSNYIDKVLDAFNIRVCSSVKDALFIYFSELYSWNLSINLTGLKKLDEMVYKHLGDTLLLFKHFPHARETMLDIGSGQGVPGLLIKILMPDLKIVLAEAVKKKCSFLEFVIARLNLKDIKVCQKRIGYRNPPLFFDKKGFDLIVSQATGSLLWLIETAQPFLNENGQIIGLKGPSAFKEIVEVEKKRKEKWTGVEINFEEELLPIMGQKRVLTFIRFRN